MHALTEASRADLEQRLADATRNRDYYNGQYREVRDMAAERETPQGRDATMASAMRLKGQAMVWDRIVCDLTAELQAGPAHLPLTAGQCADMDDTHNFGAVHA